MANLVIVESPAKGNTIKSYLGSNYKVVASKGHVRDLPKSTLGVDIDNGFAAHYINIRGKGDLIKSLKKEAKAASKVILATDPDREGEAISWHLAATLGIPDEKICRVTFNEITKTAIKEAIKHPRSIDLDLVNSQQARRILDRIVGYKLSPFLWKSIKSGLSAGRVQSVATRIIVEREAEIRAFIPKEYWTIDAKLRASDNTFVLARFYGDNNGKIKLESGKDAQKVVSATVGSDFIVKSIKKGTKNKTPAPPFTTSTLQQEASKKLGFQSQRIMRVAQELYEGINLGSEYGGVQGLITYMRTDSLRVSAEAQTASAKFIEERYGAEYCPSAPRVYKTKSGAQDAHEAIRPSNINIEPQKIKKMLSPDQYKLYKLIWERFIASQMASAVLNTVLVDFESAGYIFRTNGYTVKFQGYMAVYEETTDEVPKENDDDNEKNMRIPEMSETDKLKAQSVEPLQHFTEPPPRYNEASLIKFLEEKGIGRPSTYTPIITTIIARDYVKRDGKALVPTPLGELTTKLMIESFPDVVDYEFTATMESKLDGIENGEDTMQHVLSDFYSEFAKRLEEANNSTIGSFELPREETDIVCDKCGSTMIVKNGRFGKFAACPNYPQCKNTKPLTKDGKLAPEKPKTVEVADFKCELCGGDMVLRTGRFGSFYACANYPTCKFTKQRAKDIGIPCPQCGAKLVSKLGKNKTVFYSCESYPDCDFSSWDMPTEEKCPECGKMLFKKKGKNLIICHDKQCGYKREIKPEETEEALESANTNEL